MYHKPVKPDASVFDRELEAVEDNPLILVGFKQVFPPENGCREESDTALLKHFGGAWRVVGENTNNGWGGK